MYSIVVCLNAYSVDKLNPTLSKAEAKAETKNSQEIEQFTLFNLRQMFSDQQTPISVCLERL